MANRTRTRTWHICTECNKSLPAESGDKHRDCPLCGSIMRMELSRRAPKPVITNDALVRATKWATGDQTAMTVEELEGMSELLLSNEDRLRVVKTMVSYRQASRLAKLLSLTDDLEERLFDPEVLMQLDGKDLIRALQVLQKGIDQAKGFVYTEEPASAVMGVIVNQNGQQEQAAKALPPESREKIRAAVNKFKKLVAPTPTPAPSPAGDLK